MTRRRLLLVLLALATGLGLWLPGVGLLSAGATTTRAPGDAPIIIEVTGDAANGFEVHRNDGTSLYPPTDSEAVAECGEYDRQRQRIRCRTEVRTWYRDLGELRRSLTWVRKHG